MSTTFENKVERPEDQEGVKGRTESRLNMKKTEKLAKFLRSSREAKSLSQADVAKELGYSSPQFVSNWERGISSPPMDAIFKLAKIFDLQADAIYEVLLEESLERTKMNLQSEYNRLKKKNTKLV